MKDYSLLKKKIKLIDASAVSLEKHITELFENGYDQGCVDGQKEKLANAVIYDHEVAEKKAYERGLNESWECARKIAQTMKRDEITTCFGERDEIGRKMIFEEYSASEAIQKIKDYEKKQNGFDFKDICEEYLNVLPPVNPQQKHEDVAKAFQLGVAFGFGEKHDEMDKVIEEVKKAIEPKPKTGRWKVVSDGYGDSAYICECSECKDTVWVYKNADRKWNYCPSCGARMVEPQESEVQ